MKTSNPIGLALKTLEELLAKRRGGAINLRGIHYQVLYACHLILDKLHDPLVPFTIRLEGIEDVDLKQPLAQYSNNLYIQLKSSENKVDASGLWSMGVLQNFLQTYQADSNSKFSLVHMMRISDGMLSELVSHKFIFSLEFTGSNELHFFHIE